MNKIQQRLQILALISIYFIYKAITVEAFEEKMLWLIITILYLLTLVVSYIVITISKKKYGLQ